MKLLKPDKETAMKYDYMLLKKDQIDWKARYRYIFNQEAIEQGNMDDFEYYKTIYGELLFQYYLVEDDGSVIGRAIISQNGDIVVIDLIGIEKEMQGKGYGREFIKLIEQDVFTNSEVSGISFDDGSFNSETSAIAKKLGYKETAFRHYYKPNPNFRGNKGRGESSNEQEK